MSTSIGRKIENILLVVLVIVTVAVTVGAFRFERSVANQKLLYYQLQSIRTSINLFKVIEKRIPSSLLELATSEYQFPDEDQINRYLEIEVREGKDILDAFGNPYAYDTTNGWVRSSTKGYESW